MPRASTALFSQPQPSQPQPGSSQERSPSQSMADEPVTNRELDEAFAIRDKGIRFEFKQQRISIDNNSDAVKELGGKLDRLEQMVEDMEQKFERRFEGMEGRFKGMEGRFKGMEGRFINLAAQHPWDDIQVVEYRTDLPRDHPDKVFKLWRLQKPQYRATLTFLLKFYEVGGWQSWGNEDRLFFDSESESEDESLEDITLEQAVIRYPILALRALAQRLGVDYERMKERMKEWEKKQDHKSRQLAREKRKQERISGGLGKRVPGGDDVPSKSRKIDTKELEPITQHSLKYRIESPKANKPMSSEFVPRIGWKVGSSSEGSRPVFRDAPGYGGQKAKSEGSTIPYDEEEMARVVNEDVLGNYKRP